jgi:MoaA/NifB/PqqE/SkfB family radical SAM enzyme
MKEIIKIDRESMIEALIQSDFDHFEAEKHNAFRRNNKSYKWAIDAISHAKKAKLLTAITICVTKDFCHLDNLEAYHQLAYSLGVPFVQLMEPRATGNYEDLDVTLKKKQLDILARFYESRNREKKYRHLPIIQYTGFQQRQKSCGGAANRYIYIDTDGYVAACPFCESRKSHFLYGNTPTDLSVLNKEGCQLLSPTT